MEKKHSNRKRITVRSNIIAVLILMLLTTILLASCGGESTDSGGMQDPYDAYKIKQGDGELGFSILDDPPKTIAIQPIMIQKAYHEDAMLNMEPIIFEKGTTKSFSFDLQLTHDNGETFPLEGTVTLKYTRGDTDELFAIDTDTYGYATLVRNGIYSNELGQHTMKDRMISFTSFGADSDEYLSFTLGVDKKDAEKADGNLGIVYCKITGVKR